jgi:hypothetical protein
MIDLDLFIQDLADRDAYGQLEMAQLEMAQFEMAQFEIVRLTAVRHQPRGKHAIFIVNEPW